MNLTLWKRIHWKTLGLIFVILGLVVAATKMKGNSENDFADLTAETVHIARMLPTPPGDYDGVVWLAKNQLVFLYVSDPSSSYDLSERRMFQYTIGTANWKLIQVPQEGRRAIYAPLYRLPNGKLGFVYSYIDTSEENPLINPETSAIYMWDDQSEGFQILYRYNEGFFPSPFTFSPDMSEIILENGAGAGFHNQIYRVGRNGQVEQLFPTFERVKNPSWSTDGSTVAFLATERYSWEELSSSSNSDRMGDQLFYPWDLYLMDVRTGNARMILTGIEGNSWIPGWSPHNDLIMFRGRYKNTEGIWVLNIHTQHLTRIWPITTESYWSPDGKQMIVIQRVQENGVERTYPMIVDLPSFEQ
jgi:Tol biopolymer transport system component